MANSNILSKRYATNEINRIFSEEYKILLERELWIAVMKAQKKLGVQISQGVIDKYEAAKDKIDLKKIEEIEKKRKHDVKARIEAFVLAANTEEHVHKGMTSRDLTDNVEQLQIRLASKIILGKFISVLRHFIDKSNEYSNIVLTGRTHHQPAQPTLLGRRFAMWAEELYLHLVEFERFIEDYPLKGIKGPVGTQFDMLTLLGDRRKVELLEKEVAKSLGFSNVLNSTGQVYPRSLDYMLLSKLSLLSSACENFAKGMRLMSGYELVTEGFKKGQVGSSAMPHKMNTRSCERICGLSELVKMYADGASRLSGDQWEEGDVSCSVVRRVIIADAFYAIDGLCETTLTVINDMGVYPAVIKKEVERYMQFLASTRMLMMAVQSGIGREEAHEIIKKYAVSEALFMREGKDPNVSEKLANDPTFKKAGITKAKIDEILDGIQEFVGTAKDQIKEVEKKTNKLIKKYGKEAGYEGKEIL